MTSQRCSSTHSCIALHGNGNVQRTTCTTSAAATTRCRRSDGLIIDSNAPPPPPLPRVRFRTEGRCRAAHREIRDSAAGLGGYAGGRDVRCRGQSLWVLTRLRRRRRGPSPPTSRGLCTQWATSGVPRGGQSCCVQCRPCRVGYDARLPAVRTTVERRVFSETCTALDRAHWVALREVALREVALRGVQHRGCTASTNVRIALAWSSVFAPLTSDPTGCATPRHAASQCAQSSKARQGPSCTHAMPLLAIESGRPACHTRDRQAGAVGEKGERGAWVSFSDSFKSLSSFSLALPASAVHRRASCCTVPRCKRLQRLCRAPADAQRSRSDSYPTL